MSKDFERIEDLIESLRRRTTSVDCSNDACLFIEIPDDWFLEAQLLLNCDPSDAIILERFKVALKHRDLICLRSKTWLNDEVVNIYMQLAQERESCRSKNENIFMSSFFYQKLVHFNGGFNYSGVKKWTKHIDIFSSSRIFFPININRQHWVVVCVSMHNKKVQYFDSLGNDGRIISENILRWLQLESSSRIQCNLNGFTTESVRCPLQSTGWDCGIFALAFIDLLSNNLAVDIMRQSFCDNIRKSLCFWIFRGRMVMPEFII